MTVKLVVIYPRPDDIEAFETVYNRDHVPMAVAKLGGKTKIVASKIVGSPQGTPPFHRIAEIHFPSMEALQACAASEGGKQTIANAVAIAAKKTTCSSSLFRPSQKAFAGSTESQTLAGCPPAALPLPLYECNSCGTSFLLDTRESKKQEVPLLLCKFPTD